MYRWPRLKVNQTQDKKTNTSSSDDQEQDDDMPPLKPVVSDFVVVKFVDKKKVLHYIGKIESVYGNFFIIFLSSQEPVLVLCFLT